MSDIDFQNGFLCGMATKGLVRSGELYRPICWSDNNEFDHFYIDFRRDVQDFSTGMFNQSVAVIADSIQFIPINTVRISSSVYKIVVDLFDCFHGVSVINSQTSLIRFTTNEQVPVFGIHFNLAGMVTYINLNYAYDNCDFQLPRVTSSVDNGNVLLTGGAIVLPAIYNTTSMINPVDFFDTPPTESASVVLT